MTIKSEKVYCIKDLHNLRYYVDLLLIQKRLRLFPSELGEFFTRKKIEVYKN